MDYGKAMALSRRVASLNAAAGEIGAGMLAQLVADAMEAARPNVYLVSMAPAVGTQTFLRIRKAGPPVWTNSELPATQFEKWEDAAKQAAAHGPIVNARELGRSVDLDRAALEGATTGRQTAAALLPCPFCGGGAVKLEETAPTWSGMYGTRRWWGVVCRNNRNRGGSCAIEAVPAASQETAIARWNTRAAPTEPCGYVDWDHDTGQWGMPVAVSRNPHARQRPVYLGDVIPSTYDKDHK